MRAGSRSGLGGAGASALAVLLFASGCWAHHPYYGRTALRAPRPEPRVHRVFVYPREGQSAERQSRDRYECYRWAVTQTGFDPTAPRAAAERRVYLVPVLPPGVETFHTAAVGALLGAGIGALSGHPGQGAAIGAGVGAVAGAASESARAHERHRAERQIESEAYESRAERQNTYDRALAACLEGRGYTVK